jgi:long-chain acyl-CoA synthetase
MRPIQDIKFETLVELHEEATKAYSSNPMLGTRVGNAYEWLSYTDFDKEVQKFRVVLNALNVGMEDKVAIISNNRTEWAVAKYASNGVGGQIVPM